MAMSGGSDDGQPMMDLNTTPLIDVMLVLLIMLIFTIPVATNSVDIDLPPPNPDPPDIPIDPVKNKIVLTQGGEILWNANPVTPSTLVTLLNDTKALKPDPELQFEPEAQASYDVSAKVLNIIKGSGVPNFGFVGNEKYRVFNKDESGVNPSQNN